MALLSLIGPATKLVGKYIDNKAKKAELSHQSLQVWQKNMLTN